MFCIVLSCVFTGQNLNKQTRTSSPIPHLFVSQFWTKPTEMLPIINIWSPSEGQWQNYLWMLQCPFTWSHLSCAVFKTNCYLHDLVQCLILYEVKVHFSKFLLTPQSCWNSQHAKLQDYLWKFILQRVRICQKLSLLILYFNEKQQHCFVTDFRLLWELISRRSTKEARFYKQITMNAQNMQFNFTFFC